MIFRTSGGAVSTTKKFRAAACWPFCSLEISEASLELKCLGHLFQIKKENVTKILNRRIVVSEFDLLHTEVGIPERVVFSVIRGSKIRDALAFYGYPAIESKS